MAQLLSPEKVTAAAGDGTVTVSWEPVESAEGYKLYFYEAAEPENCVKIIYSQRCAGTVSGFKNGAEYLVSVCAFRHDKKREIRGEKSQPAMFRISSESLSARHILCLEEGEIESAAPKYGGDIPDARFSSSDTGVAVVDGYGNVTAVSNGRAVISISTEYGTAETEVAVGRKDSRGYAHAIMMFTGDIMCTVSQQKAVQKYSYDFSGSFSAVKPVLSEADLVIGALGTLCADNLPYACEELRFANGVYNRNAPSSFLTAAAGAGFTGMVTSGNNCFDLGEKGLRETVSNIKRLGMENFGTLGDNPVILNINGMKIAVICCCMVPGLCDEASAAETGKYSRGYFLELINGAMRMGAEFIIAYQHWGSMNSEAVNKKQREEAEFMAHAGADLILGSHPQVIQRIEYIERENGAPVACAFSLGNFLTANSGIKENRDGIILKAELQRGTDDKIFSKLSYIPVVSVDSERGASVIRSSPSPSTEAEDSFNRARYSVGNAVQPFSTKTKFFLSGSGILKKIFSAGKGFKADAAGVFLSQLSIYGTPEKYSEDGNIPSLKLDVEKSFKNYLIESNPDYIAVDFYTAADIPCLKMGKNVYTGSGAFFKSDFYSSRAGEFKKIDPPFPEKFWKPRIRFFAETILSVLPESRIILFRQRFQNKRVRGEKLRVSSSHSELNGLISAMEDYFISLVRPAVVNLSEYYFMEGNSLSQFEEEYFSDAYNAAFSIASGSGRRYFGTPDRTMLYERALRYYDSLESSDGWKWLLDMDCAPGLLAAYTNKEFFASNLQRIIKLDKSVKSDLESVKNFFAGDTGAKELAAAADIISAVLKGDISKSYDFYSLAFRKKFNILKVMAKLLSAETKVTTDKSNAETVFLLKGKPQIKRYGTIIRARTADIWGSPFSRESVKYAEGVKTGKFICGQSPVLAFEKPIEYEFPEGLKEFSGSKWKKHAISDAFNRKGLETLDSGSAAWLITDLYGLIGKMAECEGSLFEIDDLFSRSEFVRRFPVCFIFQKRGMKYCADMISRFAEAIAEKYGKHIILIRTEPKTEYLDSKGFVKRFSGDGLYPIKKRFIALCEERFAAVSGCFVIDIAKRFYPVESVNDLTPRYEDEFYIQTGKYISKIVLGSEKRVYDSVDENYLLVRGLRASRDKD